MSATLSVAYGLALLPAAFLVGAAVDQFLTPSHGRLSGRAFVELFQAIDLSMKVWVRRVLWAQLLLTAALLALTSGWPFALALAALGSTMILLLVALQRTMPLDRQPDRWSPADPPPDWERLQTRWHRFHVLRAVAATAAFVLVLAAALIDGSAKGADTRPATMPAAPITPLARRLEGTVYLPLAANDGQAFSRETWDEAVAVLVTPFGGGTLGDPREGCWIDARGRLVRETVRPIVISFAPEGLETFRRAVRAVGECLGQEAMYVRFEEPRIELIPVATTNQESTR